MDELYHNNETGHISTRVIPCEIPVPRVFYCYAITIRDHFIHITDDGSKSKCSNIPADHLHRTSGDENVTAVRAVLLSSSDTASPL